MRLYRQNTGSDSALEYSQDLMSGLDLLDASRPLVATVEEVHLRLQKARDERRGLEKPRSQARKKRDFAEYQAERAVDAAYAQVKAADGHRVGPATQAAFPTGQTAVKAPRGESQIRELEALHARVTGATLPALASVAAEIAQGLSAATEVLRTAETAFQGARKAWRAARDTEALRLSEHRRTMDSVLGAVRELFPGDTRLQNLVTPVLDDEPRTSVEASTEATPG